MDPESTTMSHLSVMNVTNVTWTEPRWSTAFRSRTVLIGAVGVVVNALTLVAIFRHRELTYYLRRALTSLVSTDLGLLATMLLSSMLHDTPATVSLTMVHLIYVFVDCTALTLLTIAIDRATAVFFPIWYKTVVEKRLKVGLLVLSPWVLSVIFTSASFKRDVEGLPRFPMAYLTDVGALLQACVLLGCGLGVLLAYVAIALRLTLGARRLLVHPSFLANAATGHPTPAEGQRGRRITVYTALMAVWFCLVYIPFSCYLLTLCVTGADRPAEFNRPRNILMSSIITMNSIVNPFVFFWRRTTFRDAFNFARKVVRIGPMMAARNSAAVREPETRVGVVNVISRSGDCMATDGNSVASAGITELCEAGN